MATCSNDGGQLPNVRLWVQTHAQHQEWNADLNNKETEKFNFFSRTILSLQADYSGTSQQWNLSTVEPLYSVTSLQCHLSTVEPLNSGTFQ